MPLSARITVDHGTIRRWAQDRGGRPAAVLPRPGQDHLASVHIQFPGRRALVSAPRPTAESDSATAPLTWDEFFERFERDQLAFLYQERACSGLPSRLFRIVSRQRLG